MEKSTAVTGRDHFDSLYQTQIESEAEWLRHGAEEKANSVESLLSRNNIKPRSLLELGCGTGALIIELQKRQVAVEFTGVDFSAIALDYLRRNSDGIAVLQADLTSQDSPKGKYDVIVSSHVIEHLE